MKRTEKEKRRSEGYVAAIIDVLGQSAETVHVNDQKIFNRLCRELDTLGIKYKKETSEVCYTVHMDPKKLEMAVYPYRSKKYDCSVGERKDQMFQEAVSSLDKISRILREQQIERELSVLERSVLEEAQKGATMREKGRFVGGPHRRRQK